MKKIAFAGAIVFLLPLFVALFGCAPSVPKGEIVLKLSEFNRLVDEAEMRVLNYDDSTAAAIIDSLQQVISSFQIPAGLKSEDAADRLYSQFRSTVSEAPDWPKGTVDSVFVKGINFPSGLKGFFSIELLIDTSGTVRYVFSQSADDEDVAADILYDISKVVRDAARQHKFQPAVIISKEKVKKQVSAASDTGKKKKKKKEKVAEEDFEVKEIRKSANGITPFSVQLPEKKVVAVEEEEEEESEE